MRWLSRKRDHLPVHLFTCCCEWPMVLVPTPSPPKCGRCGDQPTYVGPAGYDVEVAL